MRIVHCLKGETLVAAVKVCIDDEFTDGLEEFLEDSGLWEACFKHGYGLVMNGGGRGDKSMGATIELSRYRMAYSEL